MTAPLAPDPAVLQPLRRHRILAVVGLPATPVSLALRASRTVLTQLAQGGRFQLTHGYRVSHGQSLFVLSPYPGARGPGAVQALPPVDLRLMLGGPYLSYVLR